IEGETLADMIREDLIAERVVIQVYTEMIRHFADNDPTTRVLMEGILKDEEEHATDLTDLLYIVDPASGHTEGEDPGTRPLELHPEEKRRAAAEESRRREAGAAQQVTGRGSAIAPEHAPGTSGRPTRRRPQATTPAEAQDVKEGSQAGGSRSVHVTKPNRKRRVA
ncbi:MAG TPA: ferritin-like domain-containing protein, partial [Terriglobales bacterium]|nr:ferritin-like domain-containing protein [Terriglobales bacterium]